MNYEIGDELTFEDDKSYIVIDSFNMNGYKYLYLIDEVTKKASLVKLVDDTVYEIEDDEEYNLALNELINKNKDQINEILKETNQ